jgi:plasmid maintenance system antidote protein VapI
MTNGGSCFRGRAGGGFALIHPGEVLREDFLVPMSLSACAVGKVFRDHRRVLDGLQVQHDLERAEDELRKDLRTIEPVRAPATLSANLRGCLRVNTYGRL